MSQAPPASQPPTSMVRFVAPGSVYGENCTMDPLAVPDGFFPLLQNVRINGRVPVVRGGTRKLNGAAPVANAHYRGSWSGTLNGSNVIVVAYRIGAGEVGIYLLAPGAWTWVELTATSGMFGDTRLPGSSLLCSFCKVPLTWQGTTREVLLIANPTSAYPRVYDNTQGAGLTVSKLNQIGMPGLQRNYEMFLRWPSFLDLENAGNGALTFNSTNAHFAAAWVGASPNRYIGLTMDTSSVSGNQAWFTWPTQINATQAAQFIFRLGESASTTMFRSLKIELYSSYNSAWFTVYDPAGSTAALVSVPDTSAGCTNVTYYAASCTGQSDAVLAQITGIRFTTTTAPYSASKTLQIALIAAGGNLPGLMSFAVGFRNEYSGAESCGYILTTGGPSMSPSYPVTSEGGCTLASAGSPVELIPNSSLLYYCYNTFVENPNSGNAISGDITTYPTRADYYVSYLGSGVYTYFASAQLYAQNGTGWTGQQVGQPTFGKLWGATAVTTSDPTVPLPDGSHGYIPRPTCMLKTTSRLFMGGDYGYTSNLYFSEDNYPLRFRPTTRYLSSGGTDPASSSCDTLDAPLMGIAPMGNVVNGVQFGVPVLLVWTTRFCYRIYGAVVDQLSAPVPLGPHGLAQPYAWAQHAESIYWLDQDPQVLVVGESVSLPYVGQGNIGQLGSGGIQHLALGTVESRLLNGSVAYTSCAFWSHRLYVSYRQTGDTASVRALVYDEHPSEGSAGTWTEDLLPAGAEGFAIYDNGTFEAQLLFFTDGGDVWLHEDPTSTGDAGNGTGTVPVEITTRAVAAGPRSALWATQVGVIADDCGAGVSADVTATYLRTGLVAYWTASSSNALSLSAGGPPMVWNRTADAPVFAGSTHRDFAVQFDFKASMPSGKRIVSLYAMLEGRDGGEDQL